MPRGHAKLEIIGHSRFSRDENIVFDGLVYKVSKQVSKTEGDNLMYIVNKQNEEDIRRRGIRFETYFFDDIIKVYVFEKNVITKGSQVGRGNIDLRELSYDGLNSIFGLQIVNKRLKRAMGYLYFKLTYTPREKKLLDMTQI